MTGGEILNKKISVAIAGLTIVMMLGVAFAILWNSRSFNNVGLIKATGTLGIYWDEMLTQNASGTTLDWGEYGVAETKTKELWIVNEGNVLIYVGWGQSGMTHVGGFYYIGGTSFSDCQVGFQMLRDGSTQWKAFADGGVLVSLDVGAKMNVTLWLRSGDDPTVGSFSFDLSFSSYSTSTG